jgi:polyhydroxyalkanoate synthesis repressor PhaR
MSDAPKSSVTIKKYANRRLYNTATSSYVTLDNLAQMVKEGTEFNVYDAKTSEDITRSVLTQIIVEEEGKTGQNLLPTGFLRQLIGFYGNNMQWLVPKYLEHSMQTLAKNQEQLGGYFKTAFGGMFPFGTTLEEMSKQNLAMFDRAMKMFAPFNAGMTFPGAGVTGMGMPEAMTGMAAAMSGGAMPGSDKPTTTTAKAETASSKAAAQEKAEEDAFTPSSKIMPMPTPATSLASQPVASSGEEVQTKIAALQRQLADLAKKG